MLPTNAKMSGCVSQELEFVEYVLKEARIKPDLKKIRAVQKYSWNKDIDLGGWYCRGLLILT